MGCAIEISDVGSRRGYILNKNSLCDLSIAVCWDLTSFGGWVIGQSSRETFTPTFSILKMVATGLVSIKLRGAKITFHSNA